VYKRRRRMSKSKFFIFLSSIFPQTVILMNILLLPLTMAFVYIFFEFFSIASSDIVLAQDIFAPIFDHLMVTLMIIICGAALLDITLRETEK